MCHIWRAVTTLSSIDGLHRQAEQIIVAPVSMSHPYTAVRDGKEGPMNNFRALRALFCVTLLLGGCAGKIYPPIAMTERTNEIYPEPRPENCKLTVLTSAPAEPHDIFAHIISYAGSVEMSAKMESLIKAKACEEGAEAIILLPLRHVDHVNTDNIYPDWVTVGEYSDQGQRAQHWVDKRYSVAQRAIALVRKRNAASVKSQ